MYFLPALNSVIPYSHSAYSPVVSTQTISLTLYPSPTVTVVSAVAPVTGASISVSATDEMISYMKKHSVISSNITPHVGDQILTLSTCTSTGSKSKRFVVNAVLVNGDYKPAITQKIEVQPEIEEEVMSDDQNDKADEIFVPIEQVEEDLAQSIEIDIENE